MFSNDEGQMFSRQTDGGQMFSNDTLQVVLKMESGLHSCFVSDWKITNTMGSLIGMDI